MPNYRTLKQSKKEIMDTININDFKLTKMENGTRSIDKNAIIEIRLISHTEKYGNIPSTIILRSLSTSFDTISVGEFDHNRLPMSAINSIKRCISSNIMSGLNNPAPSVASRNNDVPSESGNEDKLDVQQLISTIKSMHLATKAVDNELIELNQKVKEVRERKLHIARETELAQDRLLKAIKNESTIE